MSLEVKRGDIFYIAPYYAVGSEQYAGRPAIIVSNDMNNKHSETYEVVYLTTKEKQALPTHVNILSAPRESTALCEQIDTVAKERIGDCCGCVTSDEMAEVDIALTKSLAIEQSPKENEQMAHELALSKKECEVVREMYNSLLERFIKMKGGE